MKRRVMKHGWKRRERNLYEGSGRRRDSWLGKQWRESRELKPERLEWNKNRIRIDRFFCLLRKNIKNGGLLCRENQCGMMR
jgi:hypothetical protein